MARVAGKLVGIKMKNMKKGSAKGADESGWFAGGKVSQAK